MVVHIDIFVTQIFPKIKVKFQTTKFRCKSLKLISFELKAILQSWGKEIMLCTMYVDSCVDELTVQQQLVLSYCNGSKKVIVD